MSNFNVGDKVRVTGDSKCAFHCFDTGTVAEVVRLPEGDSPNYLVTTSPSVRKWTTMAQGGACRSVNPADLELVTAAEPEPAADPEILISVPHFQALHIARELLGVESWLMKDILAAAEFILGEGTGTVSPDTAPADAKVDTSEELVIEDHDGDAIVISQADYEDGAGVRAYVRKRGHIGAFLTAADIDRVIAYLTALKA